MATDPMMMQGEPQAAPESTGAYTIEIMVGADGAISVSVEPGGDEAMPADPGGELSEPAAQAVPNIREAIKLVLDIYKNAGEVGAPSGDMDAMNSGYKA